MKLTHVELCGFRGYRTRLRVDFATDFTIIDGRNGVGKSTIFDAVEFALTGELNKYDGAKADGETVADYLWWKGTDAPPEDRFVEVGFVDGEQKFLVRRTEFSGPDEKTVQQVTGRLCDTQASPHDPVGRVCSATVIRDEHIAKLTLDIKEYDRYALLRDGLGASDSERWIARGDQLVKAAKRRSTAAQQTVATINTEVMAATRRIDEIRKRLVSDTVLSEAVEQLRAFAASTASADELLGPVREAMSRTAAEVESLQEAARQIEAVHRALAALPGLKSAHETAERAAEEAEKALTALGPKPAEAPESQHIAQQARDLVALLHLGRKIGLHEGHCPLCAAKQEEEDFARGIAFAEDIALALDQNAAKAAQHERAIRDAQARLQAARQSHNTAGAALTLARATVEAFEALRTGQGPDESVTSKQLVAAAEQKRAQLERVQHAVRVVETLKLNTELEDAKREEMRASERLAVAQERFGRTRKAEAIAQALYDAARRAAGETLDRRLDRVLPLMSELYRRLRPHPVWRDIEYSIRGDVRKFLKLQVGDDLNPQFLFSSGQRRATGLAFLLAVNLSLAWSRWRTIMLDDPVQHVDDFRTIHLAELCAQLVGDGRQIICAVEDAALAELFCRRLPVKGANVAKRVSLGPNEKGDLGIVSDTWLPQLPARALLASTDASAAG